MLRKEEQFEILFVQHAGLSGGVFYLSIQERCYWSRKDTIGPDVP